MTLDQILEQSFEDAINPEVVEQPINKEIKPNVEKTKEELPGLDNLPEPQCKK